MVRVTCIDAVHKLLTILEARVASDVLISHYLMPKEVFRVFPVTYLNALPMKIKNLNFSEIVIRVDLHVHSTQRLIIGLNESGAL